MTDTPVASVTSSSHPLGLIQFQGPDDGSTVLWLEVAGSSGRVKIVASDGFAVVLDEADGDYPTRPAGAHLVIWRGTTTPSAALDGDMFLDTTGA